MVGTWGFTEATNTVVVTGGTSGTPATFADFVTADRAGTATLKAATNCAKDMTLTYPIRPCELRALQISFVIASKTAETDYLWITGTDAWGTALYECIDISAGNGTYVSTQYFATITDIDIEDVGDGSGTAAADGTLQVTQPQWGVIWDNGGNQYRVDAILAFGDGSTSTYFVSMEEAVYFSKYWYSTNSSNVTMGDITTDPQKGAFWQIDNDVIVNSSPIYDIRGVFNMYASVHQTVSATMFRKRMFATGELNQSMIQFYGDGGVAYVTNQWGLYSTGIVITNLYGCGGMAPVEFAATPSTDPVGITVGAATRGIAYIQDNASVKKPTILAGVQYKYFGEWVPSLKTLTLIDPVVAPVTAGILNQDANNKILWVVTVNIHVLDKDGANLVGVSVACEDKNTDAAFTTQTTAADGTITEQSIELADWTTTSETETTYYPHKFTLSKAGYETLILENVTVDHPIVWHLELQHTKGAKSRQIGMGV